MGPDIGLPALEITADPGVDFSLVIGLNGAGQGQLSLADPTLNVSERDGRDCLRVGPMLDLRRAVAPLDNAVRRGAASDGECQQGDQQESPPAGRVPGLPA